MLVVHHASKGKVKEEEGNGEFYGADQNHKYIETVANKTVECSD